MQAYRFEQRVPASHTITLELPSDAPTGPAQIIVLFPESALPAAIGQRPADIAEFVAWLETQPPTGRSGAEIDRQLREERDSWGD